MSDDKLNRLARLNVLEPSPEARKRAVDAALLAFDAAQTEKSSQTAQGRSWAARLRSIVQLDRGTSIMNSRLTYGLGTAAIALLLLPLGYQLFTTTALTPIVPQVAVNTPPIKPPVPAERAKTEAPVSSQTTAGQPVEAPKMTAANPATNKPVPMVAPEPETAGPSRADEEAPADVAALQDNLAGANSLPLLDQDANAVAPSFVEQQPAPPAASPRMAAQPTSPGSPALMKQQVGSGAFRGRSVANSASAPQMAMEAAPSGAAADAMMAAPAGMPMQPGTIAPAPSVTQPSGDQFTQFAESPIKVTAEQPGSPFSIDVDTASYSYVRNALQNGWVPEPDAVRLEELINYFSYDYPAAESAATPFQPSVKIMPTPWNQETELVQIGIKGYVPPAGEQKAANLVFLLDTSGSMDEPDKLPLLKRAFALLVDQLKPTDTVSIVAYAGSAGVVLEPTKAADKARILSALENLYAGGSTAGAEGIELAYRLAEQNRVADGVNRVILATDGDFNVGIEDPQDLVNFIKQKRNTGVFLSVLGFGQGNLGDDTMQALAQNGNGNAAYIDSFKEAQKVLVQQAGGTLETIAKDVKIQVEFNPAFVSEYRLIGYETRALNREDFNNDKVDAGDVGAGTTVTALYEITPVGSGGGQVDPLRYGNQTATPAAAFGPADELGYLKLRYKIPNADTSKLIELPITRSLAVNSIGAASEDQRFAAAVAAFGQKLRGSSYGDMSWRDIRQLAQGARGADESGYRAEFMQLIDAAASLQPDPLCTAPEGNRNCR